MGQSELSQPVRTLLSAGEAAAAASAIYALAFVWQHQQLMLPTIAVPLFIGAFTLAAFGAGLVSGRLREIPLTWLAMTAAISLVYWTHSTLYPDWPQSEDGIYGPLIFGALYLLPVAIIGHGLAVMVRNRRGT